MKTRQQTTMDRINFTKEGYENLLSEQQQYLEERPLAVENLRKAREMGDLSENGFYKASRHRLTQIDTRLFQLDMLLKFGKVTEVKDSDGITFGNIVTITNNEIERTFTLVEQYESNPMEGKLSTNSPIGKGVLGHKLGDIISIETPSGMKNYTISKIV